MKGVSGGHMMVVRLPLGRLKCRSFKLEDLGNFNLRPLEAVARLPVAVSIADNEWPEPLGKHPYVAGSACVFPRRM